MPFIPQREEKKNQKHKSSQLNARDGIYSSPSCPFTMLMLYFKQLLFVCSDLNLFYQFDPWQKCGDVVPVFRCFLSIQLYLAIFTICVKLSISFLLNAMHVKLKKLFVRRWKIVHPQNSVVNLKQCPYCTSDLTFPYVQPWTHLYCLNNNFLWNVTTVSKSKTTWEHRRSG